MFTELMKQYTRALRYAQTLQASGDHILAARYFREAYRLELAINGR